MIKSSWQRKYNDVWLSMGSNNGGAEMPVHNVILKSFAIGRYPVTFDEYDQFAEASRKPSPDDEGWGRGKRPFINVSWEDALAYFSGYQL